LYTYDVAKDFLVYILVHGVVLQLGFEQDLLVVIYNSFTHEVLGSTHV